MLSLCRIKKQARLRQSTIEALKQCAKTMIVFTQRTQAALKLQVRHTHVKANTVVLPIAD